MMIKQGLFLLVDYFYQTLCLLEKVHFTISEINGGFKAMQYYITV